MIWARKKLQEPILKKRRMTMMMMFLVVLKVVLVMIMRGIRVNLSLSVADKLIPR